MTGSKLRCLLFTHRQKGRIDRLLPLSSYTHLKTAPSLLIPGPRLAPCHGRPPVRAVWEVEQTRPAGLSPARFSCSGSAPGNQSTITPPSPLSHSSPAPKTSADATLSSCVWTMERICGCQRLGGPLEKCRSVVGPAGGWRRPRQRAAAGSRCWGICAAMCPPVRLAGGFEGPKFSWRGACSPAARSAAPRAAEARITSRQRPRKGQKVTHAGEYL